MTFKRPTPFSCRRAAGTALAVLLFAWAAPGAAVLTIEVKRGSDAGIPIAIVPFGFEGIPISGDLPAALIEANLKSSGHFKPADHEDFLSLPHHLQAVRYQDWRLIKVEALVIGRVNNLGGDRYEVDFQVIDVFREKRLAGQQFQTTLAGMRRVAHQISDIIYRTLIGKPGVFDTRIAYVTVTGEGARRRYLLRIADADGHGARTILESLNIIMSPAWSPDGEQIAYVSFENNRSMIYVQNLWSGDRRRVAAHVGINSAPAWSPDGRTLAMTLSKDGNPEIYLYHLDRKRLRRMTRHTAIDTEPAWSPDGRTIVFTSGRSGTPQIYAMEVRTGDARRLTFNGDYNAGASFSHDGKSLALITNQGNGHRVGVYSTQDRSVSELTHTLQDESPTFAPNDEMIMYATQMEGRHVLAVVSPAGRVLQVLRFEKGVVREPAWSPFNRKP